MESLAEESTGSKQEHHTKSDGAPDSTLYDNIPDELKALPQWVGLKLVAQPKGKKPKKVPINPATGRTAAVDEPESWGTFDEAVAAVTKYRLAGIGFVFTAKDPYAGIDLDECRDPATGELQPWALDVVQRFDSYTEASFFGTGVHIIPKGTLPSGGGKHEHVEMYDHGRYFVMTGEQISGFSSEIEERQEAIDALYAEHFPHKLNGKAKQDKPKKTSTAQHNALWRDLDEALPFIPAVEYEVWLHVGMGIHAVDSSDAGLALWVEWSQRCPEKFDLAACLKRWQSFSPDGGITEKTIFALAIDNGWRSPAAEAMSEMDETEPEAEGTTRPSIRITTHIPHVVNQAEHALLALPNGPHLFQRLRSLCFVAYNAEPPKWVKMTRPVGAPSIAACTVDQLRERMSQSADWFKYVVRSSSWMPALPPEWAVKTLHGRGQWGFPVLTDVIAAPTVLKDGMVIDAPGYDVHTGLFLDTQGVLFPPIPAQPTRDDAVQAVAALKVPFADFPFAEECGVSAAISSALTMVARPAITGCVPLFPVDANRAGTGKGLLIDVSCTIATGRPAPRWAPTRDPEEDRKALLTIGLEGDACVHIDNVNHAFGSGPLDSALTAGFIKGRVLGLNKSATAPITAVFFASGNNLSFLGDMARRCVPITLETLLENPQDRTDFQQTNLLEWVANERPRLVVAALTIVKAYIVAGFPSQNISGYGSFQQWSDLIRSALIWAGCPDPCAGRATIEADSDQLSASLAQLLLCWSACYGSKPVTLTSVIGDIGQQAAEIIPNKWNELRDALAAFDDRYDGKRLDGRRIGYGLRAIRKRTIKNQRLIQAGTYNGVTKWAIHNV